MKAAVIPQIIDHHRHHSLATSEHESAQTLASIDSNQHSDVYQAKLPIIRLRYPNDTT